MTILQSPGDAAAQYVNNSAELLAFFENQRRAADYASKVEAWLHVAVPIANSGQLPPVPPLPPRAVRGAVNSMGEVDLLETTDSVCQQPAPIKPKPVPLPGTCGIREGCYQEPFTGTIWVSTHNDQNGKGGDTIEPGTVVEVHGIRGIADGKYRRREASAFFAGGQGPASYERVVE